MANINANKNIKNNDENDYLKILMVIYLIMICKIIYKMNFLIKINFKIYNTLKKILKINKDLNI